MKRRRFCWAALLLLSAVLVACGEGPPAPLSTPPAAIEAHAQAAFVLEPEPDPRSAEPTPSEDAPPPGRLAGRRICIDPGHDAYWVVGASGRTSAGVAPLHPTDRIPLHEHELTLSVAYRLKDLLEAEGAFVCVTRKARDQGGALQIEPYDYNGDGRVRTAGVTAADGPERIQPRIDWANQFEAEVLISVHFNGIGDPRVRGTEVYYSDTGPRREDGARLARAVLESLVATLRESGFAATSRGIISDRYQRYSNEETIALLHTNAAVIRTNGHDPSNCPDCLRLLTLGNNPMSREGGRYVGILVEVEFLSNPEVVETLILRLDAFDIIAAGLARGLLRYFDGE